MPGKTQKYMKNKTNTPIIDSLTLEESSSGLGYMILFNGIWIGRLYKTGLITNVQGSTRYRDPDSSLADLLDLDPQESAGLFQQLIRKIPKD